MNGRVLLGVMAVVALASTARADSYANGAFTLDVAGAHAGWVRSVEGDAPREDGAVAVAVRFDAVSPALARVVTTWLDGKTGEVDFALTSAAVIRKAKAARIASVRVPAIGFGAPDPFEIGFEAKTIGTAPLLRPAADTAVPQGDRLAAFHVDLGGKPVPVAKLGSLALRRASGGVSPAELVVEVSAGETQPWLAWSKAGGTKPIRVDYVTSAEKPVLRVTLDGCRPTSVKPTNGPTTRIALACTSAR